MLHDKFTLPAFWVYVDRRHNCPELPDFIDQCVPNAFQDPIERHIYLICQTPRLCARARRARRRGTHRSIYPDYATLVVFQGENVLWVRPNVGNEDPLGLWVFLAWIARYRFTVRDDETDMVLFRG